MKKRTSNQDFSKLVPGIAILVMLLIGGYAVTGPTGIFAWGDYGQRLDVRKTELAKLKAEKDKLKNRVELLDPNHVDPDLVSELMRRDLNVAHPDEIVVPLE